MRVGRIPYINCYPVYGAVDRGIVPLAGELVDGVPTTLDRLMAEGARDVEVVSAGGWLLIGDGLLDTNRAVAKYVPVSAPNGKEDVPVEQVLLHTSGFPNALMPPVEGGDAVTRVTNQRSWSCSRLTRRQQRSPSSHAGISRRAFQKRTLSAKLSPTKRLNELLHG